MTIAHRPFSAALLFITSSVSCALVAPCAFAQQTPASATSAMLSTGSSGVTIPTETGRDPFWPVGYTPPKPAKLPSALVAAPEAASPQSPKSLNWDEAFKQISIRGTSRFLPKDSEQERYSAFINGRVIEEGGTVEVTFEGYRYRWRVQSITEKNVTLQRLDIKSL